uniref:Uncharacterized protein n=1 Tax=Cynoglossus semilaevis TaxID=244447 RepID=A0A3P8WFJ1_CYNSE
SVIMKTSVAFWLGISFALFGFGSSLQCYSCPGGSTSSCEVKQDCNQGEDSCLTVKAEGKPVRTKQERGKNQSPVLCEISLLKSWCRKKEKSPQHRLPINQGVVTVVQDTLVDKRQHMSTLHHVCL